MRRLRLALDHVDAVSCPQRRQLLSISAPGAAARPGKSLRRGGEEPYGPHCQQDEGCGTRVCQPIEPTRLAAKIGDGLSQFNHSAKDGKTEKNHDERGARIGESSKACQHKGRQDMKYLFAEIAEHGRRLGQAMGMDRQWHAPLICFGEETLKGFRHPVDPRRVL